MKTTILLQRGYAAVRNSVLFGVLVAVSALGTYPIAAQAVPSMARQTGMQCSGCHTVFPELTEFGRQFKLRGYSISVPKDRSDSIFGNVPISALLQVSRNTTKNASTPGAEPEQFPRDRETIVQAAGLYYGGKITEKSGALVQYFYDGIERKWAMEMFDVRWADTATLGGKETIFGFTLSNNPGVTDIYNSTPMWSFPHTETPALMSNAQAATDMRLAGRVGGPGVYAMWNNTLYGEVALYRTTKTGAFRPLGWGVEKEDVVRGTAPYWRLALQRTFGSHFFSVGTFGLSAKIYTDDEDQSLGTDRFRDYAIDGEYHYDGGDHLVSAHVLGIREKQTLDGAFAAGLASNATNRLRTTRADVHYWYRRTVGGGFGVFSTTGSEDQMRYNNGEAVHGSMNGSPNTRGWMLDLNYLPVQNVKLALRYTSYSKFNGARSDYDGFGRNAKDNNSVFLLGWFMF
ncbi:MAG: cytochrome C [Burkholderiales bacterium]